MDDKTLKELTAASGFTKSEEMEVLIEFLSSNKPKNLDKKFKAIKYKLKDQPKHYLYVKKGAESFLFLNMDDKAPMKENFFKNLGKNLKGEAKKEAAKLLEDFKKIKSKLKYSQGKLKFERSDNSEAILSVKSAEGDFSSADSLFSEINSIGYSLETDKGTVKIDSDTSPFLPSYEDGEVPAWAKEDGVPQWAKDMYIKESPQDLVCSITPDGKIGSVYFGEEGRIRLTHLGGPQKEDHSGNITTQFNVDMQTALKDFKNYCIRVKKMEYLKSNKIFNQWMAETLKKATTKTLPAWATMIKNPSDAPKKPNHTKLFEVFKSKEGVLKGWHPSRGTAVNLTVSKQTVSVIEKAIEVMEKADKEKREQLKGVDIPEIMYAYWNNKTFYQVITKLDPKFAEKVRSDTEIVKDIAKMPTDTIKAYSQKLAERKNKQ